jgi:hypothetical protein
MERYDMFDDIFEEGRQTEFTASRRCQQGTITLRFSPAQDPQDRIREEGLEALLRMTCQIQIVIQPAQEAGGQVSARFSAQECYQVLGGSWPSDETFDRIANAVRERKNYPMPTSEIPGGGGQVADRARPDEETWFAQPGQTPLTCMSWPARR